jgi:hypothetical protein
MTFVGKLVLFRTSCFYNCLTAKLHPAEDIKCGMIDEEEIFPKIRAGGGIPIIYMFSAGFRSIECTVHNVLHRQNIFFVKENVKKNIF